LLIDQFLLGRHAQHLKSERCCDDRLNSPIPEAATRHGQTEDDHGSGNRERYPA
jgi:hypothetical protein